MARILLNSTVDKDRGLTHFVAQAVAREVAAGGVRWQQPPGV